MSWAAVAKQEPQPAAATETAEATVAQQTSTAVIDANAIIAGMRMEGVAEHLCTIPEVLKEVKDQKSREFLETFPHNIRSAQPTEKSVKAVMAFARDSGELHSLSTVDIKLIALAHTLEVAAHGHANLRSAPPPPRVHSKASASTKKLPGWGEEGADWDALDQATQDSQPSQGESRICSKIEALNLEDSTFAAEENDGQPTEGPASEQGPDDEQGEDGGWSVAAASHNAARRRRRKQAKYDARVAASGQADAPSQPPESTESVQDEEDEKHVEGGAEAEGSEDETEDGTASDSGDSEEEVDAGEREQGEASTSSVVCVTADFAMQNVILQMGLRLASPDGRLIQQTRRWALRCTACFQVSKEVGRLFCGKCGNAALQKVEVVVGPNGTEQYGVRKKHILRGTRFPLPKPKGGKNRKDPILREDVLLQRVPQLRARKKEAADPFAPEFGVETWHQKNAALPAHVKAAAAALAVWKHNPNERKHVRTNRRK
ncbi:probable RNA-binding protein NOB1 [Coccomyxa sp. Obi]|nr:probable RNA-binding protein NOB1 [Coccomyxa sp. Obi]